MAKKNSGNSNNPNGAKNQNAPKLKIIPLGGLQEVGKNITVLEYEDDIIVLDCGLAFPDDDMLGVDLVIPDTSYLEKNIDKIRGIVLTHGHEDHIGALPYVLGSINVPVYGTRLTLGILRNKLEEHKLEKKTKTTIVKDGETIKLGCFSIEFIHVNHSIPDSVSFAITTPVGVVIFTGDFKIDLTPVNSVMINLTRFGEYGKNGVLALMCDSTNAERPGTTRSERQVKNSLNVIFREHANKRIAIATFSSNVHRIQSIISVASEYKRKVAITGRSMLNIIGVAIELGYLKVPEGILIDINEMKKYNPEQIAVITTGSQGEPMSALHRMAFSDHDKISLGADDVVVISANPIPGNERTVGRIINELSKKGVHVLHDAVAEVHVSGHACQEELKLIHGLVKPRFFIPVHGEQRHLKAHAKLAEYMGAKPENILIPDVGKIIELDKNSIKFNGTAPSGKILVDGFGVGDVGNIVLRDRRHLAQDGLIVVVAAIDIEDGLLISGPDIVSRGFVYVRESEELMEQTRITARDAINYCFDSGTNEWNAIKTRVRDDLSKFLYQKTKRKPMVLPIIMDV
ncbi:MAG: ribonuclease J [Oscillospiraceae bacterium]|nr:ribonuclease J [Oscillospiraceae bacterium]